MHIPSQSNLEPSYAGLLPRFRGFASVFLCVSDFLFEDCNSSDFSFCEMSRFFCSCFSSLLKPRSLDLPRVCSLLFERFLLGPGLFMFFGLDTGRVAMADASPILETSSSSPFFTVIDEIGAAPSLFPCAGRAGVCVRDLDLPLPRPASCLSRAGVRALPPLRCFKLFAWQLLAETVGATDLDEARTAPSGSLRPRGCLPPAIFARPFAFRCGVPRASFNTRIDCLLLEHRQ
mmetsp:Transcript_37307/g.84016  ORF Transcript_37307/g.84016 Transcript_37307/m.84016 type:complete len:232 (+) Transcript_37307:4503-5198(+)